MSDEQQLKRLEKKVDEGFADNRAEFRAVRAELRGEVGSIHRSLQAMWLTMILGLISIVVQQHV